MKAVVYRSYGGPEVLHLEEVATPIPKDNEVLIKIQATAVNSGDTRLRSANPFAVRFFLGLTAPSKINILGGVFSGTVQAVGKSVSRYKVGDAVFGATGFTFGAYAQYLCLPQDAPMALKPTNVQHTEAAVIPFGATAALHFLIKAGVKKGQRVLVYGASGAVGTAAVQLAAHIGARVTAVCSTANVAMVQLLGATEVIDYTRQDCLNQPRSYDVIIDTVNKLPLLKSCKALVPGGALVLVNAALKEMAYGAVLSVTSGRKVISGVIKQTHEDMNYIAGLVEVGALVPVIDKTYPLAHIASAHAYADGGHKKGNIAIVVD